MIAVVDFLLEVYLRAWMRGTILLLCVRRTRTHAPPTIDMEAS